MKETTSLNYKDYTFDNNEPFVYFKTIFKILYENNMKICNEFCKEYFTLFTHINQGINMFQFFKINSVRKNIDAFIKYDIIKKKHFEPIIIDLKSKGIHVEIYSEEQLDEFKDLIIKFNFSEDMI